MKLKNSKALWRNTLDVWKNPKIFNISPQTKFSIFVKEDDLFTSVCVMAPLFIMACMVFLLMMCSIDKEDEWTNAVRSSSKPKRKMAGVLTYEMGYLVWDPSPSGKQQY